MTPDTRYMIELESAIGTLAELLARPGGDYVITLRHRPPEVTIPGFEVSVGSGSDETGIVLAGHRFLSQALIACARGFQPTSQIPSLPRQGGANG